MLLGRAGSSWWGRLLLASTVLIAAAPRATQAQVVVSSQMAVVLGATKSSNLSVTVLSGGVQTIGAIVDGTTNAFPSPVRLQTSWTLNPGQTGSVELVAFFTDPTGALVAGPGARIASSLMQGRMLTGLPTTFSAFTGNPIGGVGTAGASLRLFSETVTGTNKDKIRTDDLDLRIDLTGQPNLPTGTYTGTLYIRAVTL